jgi:hypothetical protein
MAARVSKMSYTLQRKIRQNDVESWLPMYTEKTDANLIDVAVKMSEHSIVEVINDETGRRVWPKKA